MAGICTGTVSPQSCGHRQVTITRGGVARVYHMYDADDPLSEEEQQQLDRLTIRNLRASGVTLAQFLHRVTYGEEATNVKLYSFFGPGAVITKTNIGTAYVNIPPGLNGERTVVDLTGCTEFRLSMHCNLIGTGPFAARIVRDSNDEVLFEHTNLGAAGERELDTLNVSPGTQGWLPLPAAFLGQGLMYMRAQAKSTVGGDDPVFRSLRLGLR